jgi:NAD(P)-dependent dehydrogenase (short-subunit alcohol dehydrogenase family)
MELQDKVVVITGGASGLGRATADYFVGKGARVSLFDLNEEAGNAAVAELGEDNALFALTDVTSEESVSAAVEATMEKFGAIHVNINCAGVPAPCKVLDREGKATALKKFAFVVNVNLVGLFNVMSKCAEKMALNEPDAGDERGVVINISSGAAFEGQIGQNAYSASKSGVLGLNMPAARELGSLGIRVNAICPGLFGTPMVASLDQKVQDALVNMVESPKRMGDMKEFAHCCAFLVENGYMNGRTIRLDAATVMQAK